MRGQKIGKIINVILMTVTVIFSSVITLSTPLTVCAKEITENVSGDYYEFEKNSKYELSDSTANSMTSTDAMYGLFSIKGDMKAIADVNGVPAYEIQDANVQIAYKLNSGYVNASDDAWHLIDDKSKTVDGMKLDSDILSGAVILQTSLTGDSWITDVVYTDVRGEESEYTTNFYTSKDIQQVNGCYYRIIVVYELNKKNKVDKSITNWAGTKQEYKKCAEVYEFYLIDSSENSAGATQATATPRKELGTKINTGKDNGYSGNEAIVNKDPHYGWDIGTFFVNGYTRETSDYAGNPIFLKNVGDRVTLWFNLKEDINCLNGKENLTIYEDANGYDQYFEIDKTNFKRGALIISYTDYEGKTYEPIIYTDYLAASARTGANTKVELFEEGDYEVALNYEIKDSDGVDSYTNYRIYFKFSIRNGNCMVYPFDTVTEAELADNAITENGFRLDMAKSRYLTIDVKKEIVKSNADVYVTDERFNRPAKDGETYSDEGIYTFSVKNLYTGSEPTTKVVYVGNSPVLRAMAAGQSLEEINDLIALGAELQEDGSFLMPKVEEELPEVTEVPQKETVVKETEESVSQVEVKENNESDEENKVVAEVINDNAVVTDDGTSPLIVFGAVAIVVLVSIFVVVSKKVSKKTDAAEIASEEADE
jgi:hypothetical protein